MSAANKDTPPPRPEFPDFRKLDAAAHAQLAKAAGGLAPISLALACMDWAMHLAASPGRQLELAQKAAELATDDMRRRIANPLSIPSEQEAEGRFADPLWSQWPFSMMKDSFKAGDLWWQQATRVDGMAPHNQQMVSFFAKQWMDMLSPANWPLTNPEMLNQSLATNGMSVLHGLQNYLDDVRQAGIDSTAADPDGLAPLPFAVGQDVAITPGKVVYRNELFELLQYAPATPKVDAEPLLIIPSPIMKYYIMDLSPQNSMVRYLVSQGFTVFMMSWRNPDASDRQVSMDDYLLKGVLEAIRQSAKLSDAPRIHAMGYCLGGTFLAIVGALMGTAAFQDKAAAAAKVGTQAPLPTLASVTLLAAQTDFSEPGELGIFIDDDQLKTLREQVAANGYLSGRQMAGTFLFLHARELIWARNVSRYLLGKNETGNDLMSWNADTTRLPQQMYIEYLDSLFLRNDLTQGHYKVDGMTVAMKNLRMPLMVVGTVRDHVSPWRSVYKIHLHTGTDLSFVLAAGGHNAGIISEPGHPHRSYQIAREAAGHDWVDPDQWMASAERREGSWWEAWQAWLHEHGSGSVDARQIRNAAKLDDAPGDYVMVRYAD